MQVLVTALGVRSGCLARGTRASLRPRFRAPASQGAETMQGLRPGQGRCDPTLRWHLELDPRERQRIYVITPGTSNSHEHDTKNKEAAPSHVLVPPACKAKARKNSFGQPSFCEWVCCGLWPVGFRLDPVWRLFPSRRVRWSLGLELLRNCLG